MALTLPRWLAIVLGGMAIVVAVVMKAERVPTDNPTTRERLATRHHRALTRATVASERLRQLHLLDSVRRSGSAGGGNMVARVDPSIDSQATSILDSLVSELTRSAPASPPIPVQVTVVAETVERGGPAAQPFAGATAMTYLLPDPGSTDPCRVIMRIRSSESPQAQTRMHAELASATTRDRVLGPCAFYQRFGQPGPLVDAWLRTRGWSFGLRANLEKAAPPFALPEWYSSRRVRLLEAVGVPGIRCVTGDDAACLQGLTEPEHDRRWRVAHGNWATTTGSNPYTSGDFTYGATPDFGSREWTLLADMARDLGPERFAAFWRSDRAPADAFQMATGESLANWLRRWIASTYRYDDYGPRIPLRAGVLTLLVAAAAVAAAVTFAGRRVFA